MGAEKDEVHLVCVCNPFKVRVVKQEGIDFFFAPTKEPLIFVTSVYGNGTPRVDEWKWKTAKTLFFFSRRTLRGRRKCRICSAQSSVNQVHGKRLCRISFLCADVRTLHNRVFLRKRGFDKTLLRNRVTIPPYRG